MGPDWGTSGRNSAQLTLYLPSAGADAAWKMLMPTMKCDDWVKLPPEEKVLHRAQRVIHRLDPLQKRYDRGRASGKIAKPIQFLEQ